MSNLEIDILCCECSYNGSVIVPHNDRLITCANCKTVNDFWLDGEDIPKRHVALLTQYKKDIES